MTATTRLPQLSGQDASPALLLHKWHDYDRFQEETRTIRGRQRTLEAFETSESRRPFLLSVANAVQQTGQRTYGPWHESFRRATEDLGVHLFVEASTAWRMVVGWATNPALESGIVLDHLHGFPLAPGAGVKGLLHHVAEMDIMESAEGWEAPAALPEDGPPLALRKALDAALLVRVLFGSLFLERHRDSENHLHGPDVPKDRFGQWLALANTESGRKSGAWKEAREDLVTVLSPQSTGGMVTCFDAVPAPAEMLKADCILQLDILNPHYSKYYQPGHGGAVPEDSLSPSPVHFLAVRPGAHFEFRIRLATFPATASVGPRDEENVQRRRALAGRDQPGVLGALEKWLRTGLDEWGLGAKTAAGYGYFDFPDTHGTAAELASAVTPPRSPEQIAAAHLPEGLEPGQLGPVIDDVARLSANAQTVVAMRLRRYYAKEIASWEKRRDKPTVRKRLEWLASVSGGGAG